MKLSNEVYDLLKTVIIPLLTGGATFIITVGKLWGIQYSEQIAGTMTALATLISFVINSSSTEYFKNKEIVDTDLNNKDTIDNG